MKDRTHERGEVSPNSDLFRMRADLPYQPLPGNSRMHRGLRLLTGPERRTDLLNTHVWSDGGVSRFRQDGRTLTLRHCVRCGRDFATELDGEHWQAVHIGVFRIEPLHENVSDRWLREACPMRRIPEDDDDRGLVGW